MNEKNAAVIILIIYLWKQKHQFACQTVKNETGTYIYNIFISH